MVFLDEPSAGMDPVARRFMWSVVQNIAERRKKSVVILTTHSMEEAEALCSRIAIQVDGRFRCLGSAQQIKTRYGQGLELNVRIKPQAVEQVEAHVQANLAQPQEIRKSAGRSAEADAKAAAETLAEAQLLQAARERFEQWLHGELHRESSAAVTLILLESSGASVRYQVSAEALKGRFASIGELFKLLQESQTEYNLADFQLSQTTLEQVFNRFAAMQGQASAGQEQQQLQPQPQQQPAPQPQSQPQEPAEAPAATGNQQKDDSQPTVVIIGAQGKA